MAALDAAEDALSKFQAVQWMLAEMATRTDASRMLTYKAAWLYEGRWMQMTIEVPNFMGRKLESLVVMGYDKVKKAQRAPCPLTKGRYVMFRVLSEVNDGPWASCAELGVLGK